MTLGFCNGTDTATTVGPLGDDALAKIPAGSTISFVEQTSASGYIYPGVQLMNAGMAIRADRRRHAPTTEITALFAGGHDAIVAAVCKGDAEVGVSFNDARLAGRRPSPPAAPTMSGNVVFALSPEIPNDGVAVAGDLDPALKQRITDALLAYGETEEGSAVLTVDLSHQQVRAGRPGIPGRRPRGRREARSSSRVGSHDRATEGPASSRPFGASPDDQVPGTPRSPIEAASGRSAT